MKNILIKTLSIIFIFSLSISLIYSVSSCSKNNDDEINVKTLDKSNSFEFNDALYFPQNDGTVIKYENNKKVLTIGIETSIRGTKSTTFRDNTNPYRITNPDTGEFLEIINIVEKDNHFEFNAVTSTGEQINDLIYNGDNFIESLDIFTNSNYQSKACPPCVGVIVAGIVAIVDSMQDSPLEQCTAAANNLNCPSGSSAYMDFDEGWFSTTCNVGCR